MTDASPRPAIDYFTFSLIIDDIVLPDGRTLIGQLGGGGPQAAFGMALWASPTAGSRVGLCAGVGADLPSEAEVWLAAMAIDTAGLRRHPELPTLRAWQLLEADGRRTQVWRTRREAIPAQLALHTGLIPASYLAARGFHFGVHPEHPNLALAHALRARGMVMSIEPFRRAEQPLHDSEVRALVTACDIFSPNVEEAESLVGSGAPEALVHRLGDAGAALVALRMGAEGSLLYRPATGELCSVPAVPAPAVDPVGAGNAYCGGLLVGWVETGDLRTAGLYGAVAASFVVEQVGLPAPRASLRAEAQARLAGLSNAPSPS